MIGTFLLFSVMLHTPVPLTETPWGRAPMAIINAVPTGIDKRRKFTRKGRR